MAVNVRVVRVPGAVKEVCLDDGATVGDALSQAGIDLGAGEAVTMNGNLVESTRIVHEGDRVIVAKGAKGA